MSRLSSSKRVLAIACMLSMNAHADRWGIEIRDAPNAKAAEIVSVDVGTPADLGSLRAGDLVVLLQGNSIASAEQYRQAMAAAGASGELAMVVMRNGLAKEVRLRPLPPVMGFGFTVVARPGGGAEIATVAIGGPAALASMQPGDVITGAGGIAIDNVATLQRRVSDYAARSQPLLLTVKRGEWSKEVTLTPRGASDQASVAAARDANTSAPRPLPPATVSAATNSSTLVEAARAAPLPPSVETTALRTSDSVDVITAMGNANRAHDAGMWSEAEVNYARVLRTVVDEPNSWARLCHAQVMQRKYREAVETCQSAAQFAPQESSVFQNLGHTLSRLGRYADSIAPYRRASELAPDWALPYSGSASSYYALGDWKNAEESYKQVVARDPQNVAAWTSMGNAAAELGRPVDAIAGYRKALALGPATAQLQSSLGWQFYKVGQLPDAESAFREANRLEPKDANTLVILGVVADKLGKYAEAREAWQRAVELEPSTGNGALARQHLTNLDLRAAAARNVQIAVPSPPTRATNAAPREEVRPKPPATGSEEPRAIVGPESDSGI